MHMVRSMTGYGKAVADLGDGKLTVEIRTLNGKNADINLKSSLLPKDKELLVRRKLAERLVRGTIDVFLTWEENASSAGADINSDLVAKYYRQVVEMRQKLRPKEEAERMAEIEREHANELNHLVGAMLFQSVLRFPDVLDAKKSEVVTEENWPVVEEAFDAAVSAVDDYRQREGAALYKDVTSRVSNILSLYDDVESHEAERIEAVRAKIQKNMEEMRLAPDKDRFEQEMIFYLEKMDINEERVRLRQHCKYFMETIDSDPYPGKKLGFIIQEMGREINTTGSKANHSAIQKDVILMKDELEKMREQSMNIL